MLEKLEVWRASVREKWWGIALVYFSILMTTYVGIWAAIEPLNIPDEIQFTETKVSRSLLHILITLLLASHATLILYLFSEWHRHNSETQFATVNENSTAEILAKLLPKRDQLIYEKTAMRDKRISRQTFASRVLLALNGKTIGEQFAHELLRRSAFDIDRLDDDTFTLVKTTPPTTGESTNAI